MFLNQISDRRKEQLSGLHAKRCVEMRNGRLVIPVPNATSCSYGRCAMCGYAFNAGSSIGGLSEIEQQSLLRKYLEMALPIAKEKKPRSLDIYCSGSFLSPNEVFPSVAEEVLSFAHRLSSIREITIESLPQYVTPVSVKWLSSLLPDKVVIIGMGLETQNEAFRRDLLEKDICNAEFNRAVTVMLATKNVRAKMFILVGLPLMPPEEYVFEALSTMTYCINQAVFAIELQPVCIFPATRFSDHYSNNSFIPPSLQMITTILKHSRAYIESTPQLVGRVAVSTTIRPTPQLDSVEDKALLEAFNRNIQHYWEKHFINNWPDGITSGGSLFRKELMRELAIF